MSHKSSGGNVVFQCMIYVIGAGVLLTVIGDVWIHWIPILLGLTVGVMATQSTGKQKMKNGSEP